jgi:hypothetical protein
MFLMFLKSIRVNECIIKVCSAKSIKVGSKNMVDEILKCCWAIGETKRHNQRLKKAISGSQGGLLFLPFRYLDEVIGSLNI